jgi:hypothetical protein
MGQASAGRMKQDRRQRAPVTAHDTACTCSDNRKKNIGNLRPIPAFDSLVSNNNNTSRNPLGFGDCQK